MNHLQEAKKALDNAELTHEGRNATAQTHALIAIAEQLEIANKDQQGIFLQGVSSGYAEAVREFEEDK